VIHAIAFAAFYDALEAAGYKPEFHIYSSGGHGWGMRKQGKSSDHRIDDFYYWLEAQGLTGRTSNRIRRSQNWYQLH
jgi:hypothetical protein